MSDSPFRLEQQRREVPYHQFKEIVKRWKCVWARLSHQQRHPDHIEACACLMWQYDEAKDRLYSITITGNRVECDEKMPAFHIFDIEPV